MNILEKLKIKPKMPHAYVIIISIVIFVTILTWIVPAGQFTRVVDENTGAEVVVAEEFQFVKRSGVSLLSIPKRLVEGLLQTNQLIIFILVAGGAFNIIIKTGFFQAFTAKLAKLFFNKEFLIIPAITTIFAFACTTQAISQFIGFALLGVTISRSLGYDAIIGVAMILLGGGIGFSTGTLNPSTTGIAQAMAGLPLFSGLGYRVISWVVFLIVTNAYLIQYARKIKKNPELSIVRELELEAKKLSDAEAKNFNTKEDNKLTIRQCLVGLVMLAGFVIIVYGGAKLKYGLLETMTVFVWMGILSGLVGGLGINNTTKEFINGAKDLVFGSLIVGLARAISGVLADGLILDTTVYYLAQVLSIVPAYARAGAMFVIQLCINGLIISGSGQAAATMPIMIPVGDIVGMTRQTVVLAFNFGDGFSNYILPTSSAVMGFIGIANIGYDKWIKFMWKLFLIWVVTGIVLVTIAQAINYGPF